jgi:hypothetical protein
VTYREAADRQQPGALQELAAVDAPVAVLVVQVVDALVDLDLGQLRRHLLGHLATSPAKSAPILARPGATPGRPTVDGCAVSGQYLRDRGHTQPSVRRRS